MAERAYEAGAKDVYSRLNAMFYLATVRYIGVAQNDAQECNDSGTHRPRVIG